MERLQQSQYELCKLDESSAEYIHIKTRVEESKGRTLVVKKIERIINDTIEKRYTEKKREKELLYPNLKEESLFHGTSWPNTENICKNNFSPSLCKDAEYGKGIYFSQSSAFAAIYPGHELSPTPFVERPMLLCKVMIGNAFVIKHRWEQRYKYTSHPEGYDTTIRRLDFFPLGLVCKCGDDEFLPEYLITYIVWKKCEPDSDNVWFQ